MTATTRVATGLRFVIVRIVVSLLGRVHPSVGVLRVW